MSRTSTPISAQLETLLRSRRRCALCFGLEGDCEIKAGQIAHVDRDNRNHNSDNLVFFCLKHHDQYDSVTRQSKGLTVGEVKHYRHALYLHYEQEVASSTQGDNTDKAQYKRTKMDFWQEWALRLRLRFAFKLRSELYYATSYRDILLSTIQSWQKQVDAAFLERYGLPPASEGSPADIAWRRLVTARTVLYFCLSKAEADLKGCKMADVPGAIWRKEIRVKDLIRKVAFFVDAAIEGDVLDLARYFVSLCFSRQIAALIVAHAQAPGKLLYECEAEMNSKRLRLQRDLTHMHRELQGISECHDLASLLKLSRQKSLEMEAQNPAPPADG